VSANWPLRLSLAVLALVHLAVLGAGFLAPYDVAEQDRERPFAPPTRLRFVDAQGRIHLRPFVYRWVERADAPGRYEEDRSRAYPVRLLVRAAPAGHAPGRSGGVRLFGVDEPARVSLLGTDGLGRDQLSRLLHGGRVSLAAGLLATALSLGIGWMLGLAAGFHGGWVDALLMRASELFLAVPWLYLLFAVRGVLPLHVAPAQAFLLVVLVIGLVDWARPARLVRGVALSARERNYVLAARGFGASTVHLLRRHVAPQTLGVVLTQFAILVPQYVLAEVTLSFLGLGVAEPVPSWGNMLATLQQYHVLTSYWWMWTPGLALIPLFLAYYAVAEALRGRAGLASV
jgi:peptide/nickel transport system permease protein